jgi:biotin synthesis protein BioG
MTISDYRELSAVGTGDYEHKYLFAWSFGVWAAERLFAGVEFEKAVALCGSPLPADDRHGLGLRRMKLTLRSIEGGMEEFYRRSMGEAYSRFEPLLPVRDPKACADELSALIEASAQPYTPAIRWDAAIVGERDVIFPQANLLNYWGSRAEIRPLPHYPFAEATAIEEWIKR